VLLVAGIALGVHLTRDDNVATGSVNQQGERNNRSQAATTTSATTATTAPTTAATTQTSPTTAATTAAATAANPSEGSPLPANEDLMFTYINNARRDAGMQTFRRDARTNDAARIRARELSVFDDIEVRPDGRQWHTVLDDANVNWRQCNKVINNLPLSTTSFPRVVVDGWLSLTNTPILDPRYNAIGIAAINFSGTVHFVAYVIDDGSNNEAD
jgi:uncharacterized protein YkwD